MVGAGVTLLLVVPSVGSDEPLGEGVAAALSNGLVLFFLMAGLGGVNSADRSVASVALTAAIGTLVTVLTVRLVAVAAGAGGPFGSATDTVLDVAGRSVVVFVLVAATGHWSRRPRPASPAD